MDQRIEGLAYFNSLNPIDIWHIRQNKPRQIARDFEHYGISSDITFSILLGRGVFKWLSVRRDLIKLKITWKERIKETLEEIRYVKGRTARQHRLWYLRGYLKAYEETRAEIWALCHSERFRAPDFDCDAQEFLNTLLQNPLKEKK